MHISINDKVLKYQNGDIVYLITDNDQHDRMVVGVFIEPNNITYKLAHGTTTSWHNEIEISSDKDIIKTLNN